MDNKIACAHPGRIGDALYCLPAIRWLCEQRKCKADFYTSEYCAPMKELVEYQPYINKFVVLNDYIITGNGPGHQPWYMPVPDLHYDCVYQMGFRNNPDRFLADWISRTVGGPERLEVWYDFPATTSINSNYIVISPRGKTTYEALFTDLAYNGRMTVIQVGARGEAVGGLKHQDFTHLGLLETLSLMARAKAFVGLMSANLVLANGFYDLPKFIPHDGMSWDMRHIMNTRSHHYLVNPTAEEILGDILGEKHEHLQQDHSL